MDMKQRIVITAAALCLLLAGAAMALAQEETVALTLQGVSATAFKELKVGSKVSKYGYGLQEALTAEGSVLLRVDALIAPPWSEQVEQVNVDAERIVLLTGEGAAIPMVGYFSYGEFELQSNSLNAYRPYDWKENKDPLQYNAVFIVPRDTASLTFKLGAVESKIEGSIKVKASPNPADIVTLAISKAAFVDRIVNTTNVGELKQPTAITTSHGKLLAVDLKLTPKEGNSADPDSFLWSTSWIAILCDNGHTAPTLGELFMDGLSDYVSHNLSRGSDGAWTSTEGTFYFAVPADTKTFKLVYYGTPLAEASVGVGN